MASPIPATRAGGNRWAMPHNFGIARGALVIVLAGLMAAALSLTACGDDDEPSPEAQRDSDTTNTTGRDSASGEEAERTTRAIAAELKELQREVAETGRKLVEGTAAERDAAERELRREERRARELAERVERDVRREEGGRAALRQAARQTERGLTELRRFAEGDEDALARANAELEAAESSLRAVAASLRAGAREEDIRRALERLRERVPDIPTPTPTP